MASLTPTTELEAVNRILASIGEYRINTLTGTIPEDAAKARDRLHGVSRDFQAKGWSFNTDTSVSLAPDTGGTVYLPSNALNVVFVGETTLTIRGQRVYDRSAASFNIARTLTANVTSFLPFEELPEQARSYIFVAACRSFQDDEMMEGAVHRIRTEDVSAAWAAFLHWDAEQNSYSLNNNTMLSRMKQRRRVG